MDPATAGSSESTPPALSTHIAKSSQPDNHPSSSLPFSEPPTARTDATLSVAKSSPTRDLTGVGSHLNVGATIAAQLGEQVDAEWVALPPEIIPRHIPAPNSFSRLPRSDSPSSSLSSKRFSFASSVASSPAHDSDFDSHMTDSLATSHGNGSMTAVSIEAWTPPTKRQKCRQSPSSSRTRLVDIGSDTLSALPSRRRPSSDDAVALFREGMSPSDHYTDRNTARPEPRHHINITRGQFTSSPEPVEGQLSSLKIDGPHRDCEKALSVIEEGRSDAGHSSHEHQSVPSGTDGPGELLRVPNREPDACSSLEDPASDNAESVLSRVTRRTSLRATTVEGDGSGDESDSFSEASDGSEESASESFSRTSYNPDLPEHLLLLERRISSFVLWRINEWLRSHAPGSSTRGGPPLDLNTGTGSSNDSGRQDGQGGRKRGIDDSSGGGGDRDDPKKPKSQTPADIPPEPELRFACPLMKKHTDVKDWPKSCRTGFSQVHRIK